MATYLNHKPTQEEWQAIYSFAKKAFRDAGVPEFMVNELLHVLIVNAPPQ